MTDPNLTALSTALERAIIEVIDLSIEPAALIGEDGKVAHMNPAGTELFGAPLAELVGQRMPGTGGHRAATRSADAAGERECPGSIAVITGSVQQPESLRLSTKDGRALWVLASAVPLFDDSGKARAAVVQLATPTQPFVYVPLPILFWRIEADDFVFLECNVAAHGLDGEECENLTGRRASELLPGMDEIIDCMRRAVNSERSATTTRPFGLTGVFPTRVRDVTCLFFAPDMLAMFLEESKSAALDRLATLESEIRNAELACWRRFREDRRALIDQYVRTLDARCDELARELHDGVGQIAASLALELGAVADDKHSEELKGPLGRARNTAESIVEEIQRLTLGLHPRALDDLGLGPALRHLTHSFHAHLDVDATYAGLDELTDRTLDLAVYRIVQEALSNVVRHSASRAASLLVRVTSTATGAGHVRIVVENPGPRRDDTTGSGFGLRSLRERVDLLGGHLDTNDLPDGGFSLNALLPVCVSPSSPNPPTRAPGQKTSALSHSEARPPGSSKKM